MKTLRESEEIAQNFPERLKLQTEENINEIKVILNCMCESQDFLYYSLDDTPEQKERIENIQKHIDNLVLNLIINDYSLESIQKFFDLYPEVYAKSLNSIRENCCENINLLISQNKIEPAINLAKIIEENTNKDLYYLFTMSNMAHFCLFELNNNKDMFDEYLSRKGVEFCDKIINCNISHDNSDNKLYIKKYLQAANFIRNIFLHYENPIVNLANQILSLENSKIIAFDARMQLHTMYDVFNDIVTKELIIPDKTTEINFTQSITESSNLVIDPTNTELLKRFYKRNLISNPINTEMLEKLKGNTPGNFIVLPIVASTETKDIDHVIGLSITKNCNNTFDVLVVNKGYLGNGAVNGVSMLQLYKNITDIDALVQLINPSNYSHINNLYENLENLSKDETGTPQVYQLDKVFNIITQKKGNCQVMNPYWTIKFMTYMAKKGLTFDDLSVLATICDYETKKIKINIIEGKPGETSNTSLKKLFIKHLFEKTSGEYVRSELTKVLDIYNKNKSGIFALRHPIPFEPLIMKRSFWEMLDPFYPTPKRTQDIKEGTHNTSVKSSGPNSFFNI